MAKKTIVYEVVTKNGHGTETQFYVGTTKQHLKKALETKDVKVETVKSLGQKVVIVQPDLDQYNSAAFKIDLDGSATLEITPNDLGYEFLRDKFLPQVDALENDLKSQYE